MSGPLRDKHLPQRVTELRSAGRARTSPVGRAQVQVPRVHGRESTDLGLRVRIKLQEASARVNGGEVDAYVEHQAVVRQTLLPSPFVDRNKVVEIGTGGAE